MTEPVTDEQRCAIRSLALAEPHAATAGPARRYLVIEHSGAWGRDAVIENDLDDKLTAALKHLCDQHAVKALMMRRPGRVADRAHASGRTVFAATVTPHRALVKLSLDDPDDLLHLEWDSFDSGDLLALHTSAVTLGEPVALVCAHAKRDRCCAIGGRPIAADLGRELPGLVWECSHLGGHRFSPTALMLPLGAVYARLDGGTAREMYDAARNSEVIPHLLRGLSRYERPLQAADIAIRTMHSLSGIDAVTCTEEYVDCDTTGVVARTSTGRMFRCGVETHRLDPARPESCGKSDAHPLSHTVTSIEELSHRPG
ncbi:sucrase/ferredoxin-like protein [Antricoccus suffuscus]|uniref:Sucrase/ferredoxin-like protein n=1 Tax=Antricoccus suffuscus TaxID=1629062 RepID=A0A2T1A4N3_9ACTN|nr:sucrase ferredoxin [Antricoccus suffuscus]PRZ43561.1 sucrase/ferredoxin-like protein [Antricoccus suffuscus]